MSLSTVASRTIMGRTFKCSDWTAGHLQATIDDLAERYPESRLVIIQPCYNTGVDASAGTHDFDGVFDVQITGMTWSKAQSYLRGQGWAAWHRTPAQGFADHIHMATIPPGLSGRPTAAQVGAAYAKLGLKVGKYIDGGWTTSRPHKITATCQVADYFAHAYGLANAHTSGGDRSWFPADIASTIHQPTAAAKPTTVKPPAANQRVRDDWTAHRVVDIHHLAAVEASDRQPWASAAYRFHHAVNAAYDQYIQDTEEKR